MLSFLLAVARMTAGLFAGTCLYAAAVAMPARRRIPRYMAHAHFVASLRYSEQMQPLLHVLSLLAAVMATAMGAPWTVVLGIVVLLPVLPLSLLWGRPIYRTVRALPPDDPAVDDYLARFSRLHLLRTVLAVAAFLLLVQTW